VTGDGSPARATDQSSKSAVPHRTNLSLIDTTAMPIESTSIAAAGTERNVASRGRQNSSMVPAARPTAGSGRWTRAGRPAGAARRGQVEE